MPRAHTTVTTIHLSNSELIKQKRRTQLTSRLQLLGPQLILHLLRQKKVRSRPAHRRPIHHQRPTSQIYSRASSMMVTTIRLTQRTELMAPELVQENHHMQEKPRDFTSLREDIQKSKSLAEHIPVRSQPLTLELLLNLLKPMKMDQLKKKFQI